MENGYVTYGRCCICSKPMYEPGSSYIHILTEKLMGEAHSSCIQVEKLSFNKQQELKEAYNKGRQDMLDEIKEKLNSILFGDIIIGVKRDMTDRKYERED